MAKTENIADDYTGKQITYPYISARSMRIEISPSRYVWLTGADLVYFANGKNMGEWVQQQMDRIIEDEQEPEVDY